MASIILGLREMELRGDLGDASQRLSMLVRAWSGDIVQKYELAQRLLRRSKPDDATRLLAARLVMIKRRSEIDPKLYLKWAAQYIAQECWLEGERRGRSVDDVTVAKEWNKQWSDSTKDWVLYCYLYLVGRNEDRCLAILRDSEVALQAQRR